MYLLFYDAIIKPQVRTVVITDIDSNKFSKLYSQHSETLSCPCSKIATSYKTFVSNAIEFHPVCSSFFISKQWIETLYLSDQSIYGVGDFRTTAASQFQLLSSLCLLSEEMISKNEINLNDKELATTYLLPQSKIQLEVDVTTQSFKSGLSTQMISFIDYLRFMTRANNFVTSLNTNVYFSLSTIHELRITGRFIEYDSGDTLAASKCDIANPIAPTAFYIEQYNLPYNAFTWYGYPPHSTIVKEFFSACTPLETLLQSTLDCLYDMDCLQLLTQYFPSINQTNLTLTDYVLQLTLKVVLFF